MNISEISIKRPVATIMLVLMVVVLGVYSFINTPKDLMPDIELPVALVMTTYNGASPEEVETMITEPVEQSLASVENLDTMVSYSLENTSVVMLRFDVNTDMNFATLDMREAIALISDYLPDDATEPMVIKMDMDMLPVMQVYVSGDMELEKLNTTLKNDILSYFERSSGVASVSMLGGVEEQIAIEFNQETLSGYGLNLATLTQILAAENINLPSGDVNKGDTKIIVRTMGEFKSVEDLKNLPVMVSDYSVVRLGELATITQGYKDQEALSRIDGETAIGIMVSKQSDANTVDVCNGIEKVIKKLEKEYPNLQFTVGYNSADYINMSINSVGRSALVGALLAIFFVFLFLANVRSTLVIAISIPTSLLATFALMKFRGITLNLITLFALTLVVGMLVDNSIVVLENIFRLRQTSKNAIEAAVKGSKEIFMAVAASTLTTVVVFLPIALSGGMAGMIFKDFCFTIVIALLASLAVAMTVVPMFCSKLMEGNLSGHYLRVGTKRYKYKLVPRFGRFIVRVRAAYRIYVAKALRNRKKFLAGCIIGFAVSIVLVGIVGWELMPDMDQGEVEISVSTPYGTSLEDKDAIMTRIEQYLLEIPEMDHVSLTTGALSALSSDNRATITAILKPLSERERSTKEIAAQIRKAITDIPGADIDVSGAASIEAMFADHDISIEVMGKDMDTLQEIGREMTEQVSQLKIVDTAELDITEGNPEIQVIIDRNAASFYGINAYNIANGLSNALKGVASTDVNIDGDDISVRLSLSGRYSESVESMKQIMITGATGQAVPVDQVATFKYDNSPASIRHNNQQRYVVMNVDIVGNDLNKANEKVMEIVNSYPMPEGYYINTAGLEEQMMDVFGDLLAALVVAILLVFLILAAQFESVTMPFIVVMAIPFAMSGAFLALFITNTSLSMTSFLGLIVLVGTVVNNSILLVEFINQNKKIMGRDEALVQAGSLRLRPIMMSAGTTVVGMIPMSLGIGEGGELLAPLGISIIGGLIASTVVTLFLIPVLYAIIDDRRMKRAANRRRKAKKIAALEAKWAKEDALNV